MHWQLKLARMIMVKTGHKYLIIKTKIFFRRKVPSPCRISSSMRSIPITLDTRRLVIKAATGIITELVRKIKEIQKLHADDPDVWLTDHNLRRRGFRAQS